MREGDDPRDIYWRKSTLLDQLVLRERARETRPDVELSLDVRRPAEAGDDWAVQFERRIRDVASRAVAHLKRGDGVTIVTTAGERVRADRSVGADRTPALSRAHRRGRAPRRAPPPPNAPQRRTASQPRRRGTRSGSAPVAPTGARP